MKPPELRLSTNRSSEVKLAEGAGQGAAHRRPIPCPGVEGPDQESHYDARQEEAKDRLTRHPGNYRPPRAPRRRCARAFQELFRRVKLTGGPQEENYGAQICSRPRYRP